MNPCHGHDVDLALLAGGELEDERAVRNARAHVADCDRCGAVLAEIEALLGAASGLRAAAADPQVESQSMGLEDAILARLALEDGLKAAAASPTHRMRRHGAPASAWMAAGIAVVMLAGAVVVDRFVAKSLPLTQEAEASQRLSTEGALSHPAVAGQIAPVQVTQLAYDPLGLDGSLPVRVKRAAAGVELSWEADGRERPNESGLATTYRVLASSSARDFTSAQPLEVAGRQVVATMALPSARQGDRTVTYFKVQ